ncbi:MAG: hypothetical protein Q4F57_09950 [Weeksellaceae bacterium]|nr:hypothetical protein [Weeksellaceae bacterium]
MKTFFTIILMVIAVNMYSQVGVSSGFTEGKWRTGGGVNLGFAGNNGWFFSINPFVGYMVHPRVELGVTAGYMFSNSNWMRTNMFSVGPYTNLFVTRNIFARGHYEHLSGSITYKQTDTQARDFSENALWLGAGYQSTGRVRMQIGMQYNVLHDGQNSIFGSPWRQFGGVALSL